MFEIYNNINPDYLPIGVQQVLKEFQQSTEDFTNEAKIQELQPEFDKLVKKIEDKYPDALPDYYVIKRKDNNE